MPIFNTNRPITTREAQVAVENALAPGTYTFQLVVEDDAGNRSRPASAVVTVLERRTGGTTTVIRPTTVTTVRPSATGIPRTRGRGVAGPPAGEDGASV